jgi:hypothetical protein
MKAISITTVLLLISTLIFAQNDKTFFKDLETLKGKTFFGKAIYMPDTINKNDFWGKKLNFTVSQNKKSELRLPFHVGENKSRTWVLTKTKNGIQLKHDHRHDDGSPDSITNYGGDSDIKISTALAQYFPADEFTAKLIPAAATNRWIMEFSPDKKKFYYILERNNILRFKAEFNLEN